MKSWFWLMPLAFVVVGCHLFSHVEPTRPTSSTSTAAPTRPGVIAISPANTSIAFTGSTSLTSQSGHFEGFEGTLELPTDNPKDMKIQVSVDMNSTTTKIGLLTKHLKSDDFFDVARYPKSEFVLESIVPSNEAGRYQVSGKITLHGVQKPIAFPARITCTLDEVSFEATMTIHQTEFGMIEAAKKTKDEVPVTVSIRGRRK